MPSVYGIHVNDTFMASLAKKLLTAHVCVVVLVLLSDLFNIIRYALQASAVSGINGKFEGFQEDGTMGGLTLLLLGSIGGICCNVVGVLLARSAVDGNNRYALHCICLFDSICSCCSCVLLVQAVLAILGVAAMQASVNNLACTGGDQDSCEEFKASVNGLLGHVSLLLSMIAAGIACQVCTFCFGAYQANEADQSIQAGLKFTDIKVVVVDQHMQSMQPWKMFP